VITQADKQGLIFLYFYGYPPRKTQHPQYKTYNLLIIILNYL